MFRVGIKRGEDLDLWLRVALEYDIAYLNQAKVFYRTGMLDSLSVDYSQKGEFPYCEWLNYKSKSPYYKKYVALVMYIHAKNAFKYHDYRTCLKELAHIRTICWSYRFAKCLFLRICSYMLLKK